MHSQEVQSRAAWETLDPCSACLTVIDRSSAHWLYFAANAVSAGGTSTCCAVRYSTQIQLRRCQGVRLMFERCWRWKRRCRPAGRERTAPRTVWWRRRCSAVASRGSAVAPFVSGSVPMRGSGRCFRGGQPVCVSVLGMSVTCPSAADSPICLSANTLRGHALVAGPAAV